MQNVISFALHGRWTIPPSLNPGTRGNDQPNTNLIDAFVASSFKTPRSGSSRLPMALLAILLGLIGSGLCCQSHKSSQHLTATTSGIITGHWLDDVPCVVEYLGIPYAKPPVGDLRFEAPHKLDASNGTYYASDFGHDCPHSAHATPNYPRLTSQARRIISYFSSPPGTKHSEDCLTLNIWSKATHGAHGSKKPVFVFFHGGAFAAGNTNTPFYNGKYLANEQHLVVITVNYRLGILGFPGAPGKTQNLGLRDQRLAVQWIHDNVESFGGDARKIIIAGQSAGAVAVDYWAYAYQQDAIVHGIIAHSGNALSFPGLSPKEAEEHWAAVVQAVGCGSNVDQISCVKRVEWTKMLDAAAAVKAAESNTRLRPMPPFSPVPDDEVVFSNYTALNINGSFAPLPILLGNNRDEDKYYAIAAYARGVVATPKESADFVTDSFTRPVTHQAQARHDHGVASWAYLYQADWDNTRLFPGSGAYHGVDLHMIFGASAQVSGLPTTVKQQKLTARMQHAWYLFCEDPWNGLAKIGWPRFDMGDDKVVIFGAD
ncbi:hypothetical protein CDD82_7431 [Ophiocordyceps australis]|uniref:Carboxylic ester hydrolase n=1 Tax=Ophiocordyceps australis TaxID=1399860 RepID=A0A2C5YQN4_9HYPO|nr:hypothetical protein CDD82_7431 [Ophiocordyceps australis]